MPVQVIGVPFNSSGHGRGVALAPDALRRAGLLARLAAAGLEVSDDGDVEVGALALGLPAEGLPAGLSALTPLLQPHQVSLLGPRDEATIVRDGVASLRGTVPMHTDVEVIVRGPAAVAAQAARDVGAAAAGWWLHVDLDVLATQELSAVDYPQPGGLTWRQLGDLTAAALTVPGCAGWTVTIYNPDLDPDGSGARRVVDYLAGTAPRLAQMQLPLPAIARSDPTRRV